MNKNYRKLNFKFFLIPFLIFCFINFNLKSSPPYDTIIKIMVANLNNFREFRSGSQIVINSPIFSLKILFDESQQATLIITNQTSEGQQITNQTFENLGNFHPVLNYTNSNKNYLKNNSNFIVNIKNFSSSDDKDKTERANLTLKSKLIPLYLPLENSIIEIGDILQGRTWIGQENSPDLFGKINIYLIEQDNNESFIASVDPDNKGFWQYQIKEDDLPINKEGEIKLKIKAQLVGLTGIIDSYDQVIRYFTATQFPFTLSEYKEPIETIEAKGYNNDIIAGINQGTNFKLVDYKKENEKFSPDTIASNINGFILDLAIDSFGNIIASGFQGSKTFLKKFSIENKSEDLDFSNNTNSVLQNKSCPNHNSKLFVYGDQIIMSSCSSANPENSSSTNPALLFFDKDGTLNSETIIQGLNNASIQNIVMPSLKEVVIGSRSNTDPSVWFTSIDLDSSNQNSQNISQLSQHSIIKILVQKLPDSDSVKYIVVAIDETEFKLKVIRLNSDFSIDNSFNLENNSNLTNPIDAALTEDGNLFILLYNKNKGTSNIAFFDQDGSFIKQGDPFLGLANSLILQDISAIAVGSVFENSQSLIKLANYSTGTNIFTETVINQTIPRHSFVIFLNRPNIFDIFGTAPTTGLITLAVRESDKNSFPSGFLAPLIDENYTLPLAIPNEKSVIRSSSNYFNGNRTISTNKIFREFPPPKLPEVTLFPYPLA